MGAELVSGYVAMVMGCHVLSCGAHGSGSGHVAGPFHLAHGLLGRGDFPPDWAGGGRSGHIPGVQDLETHLDACEEAGYIVPEPVTALAVQNSSAGPSADGQRAHPCGLMSRNDLHPIPAGEWPGEEWEIEWKHARKLCYTTGRLRDKV